MREIVLAIKPKWAKLILAGEKTVEIRRRIWRGTEPVKLLLYASAPVSAVVGEVMVSLAIQVKAQPEYVDKFAPESRLSADEAKAYIKGANWVWAVHLENPVQYIRPRSLEGYGITRPPQNFCYVPKPKSGDQ